MSKLRIQRPVVDADRPAPLPKRQPGDAMAAEIAQLTKERDALEGAEMAAVQRADLYERETIDLAGERDAAIVDRDELADAALPLLDGPVEPTAEPVDALVFNELCEQRDFLPDQDIGDGKELRDQIEEFGREYAGWV